jgi:putative glycosyltransferase (TIGR04372 family)
MFFLKIYNICINQINQIKTGGIKVIIYKIKKLVSIFFILIMILFFFPFFLIIRTISNFILIRFGSLPSRSIGHFSCDANSYICGLEKEPYFKYDFFFLQKPVCNYALVRLFQNFLLIFPEILILPFIKLNKIKFIGHPKHFVIPNRYYTGVDLRDRDIEDKKINYFDQKDIQRGNSFLKNLGLNQDDKFVCLLCRDDAYVKDLFSRTYDWDYTQNNDVSTFRNCRIENFELASKYLIELGYYVFRMGAKVSKPFSINNKKFVDYATVGIRNEFLDIFLSANCDFFLSTSSGLDSVAEVFDRPLVIVSHTAIGHIRSSNKKHLTIFKHQINEENKKSLTLSEIFDYKLADAEKLNVFKKKNINLIENSPEEIKEVVIEMLKLKKNNFMANDKKNYLQLKFWNLFKNKINQYNLKKFHANFFKAHVGSNFLEKNKNFLE